MQSTETTSKTGAFLSLRTSFIVLAVLGVGIGGYWYWGRVQSTNTGTNIYEPEQASVQQKAQITSSGWKTYKNNKYRFAMKYPSTWEATSSYNEDGQSYRAVSFLAEGEYYVDLLLSVRDAKILNPESTSRIRDIQIASGQKIVLYEIDGCSYASDDKTIRVKYGPFTCSAAEALLPGGKYLEIKVVTGGKPKNDYDEVSVALGTLSIIQ